MVSDTAGEVIAPADAAFVEATHALLDRILDTAAHVGDEDRMLFRLAVSEVATNIVEHARSREPVEVGIVVRVSETELSAVFTDNADPALIDLENIDMPGADAESGRGLAIALATLDELTRSTAEGSTGNTWTLRRALRA